MNILIIDDHAIVRRGLIQLLKEEFSLIEVVEASNSDEVNANIKTKIWDIILLDISLAGQNGIDVLIQLRGLGIKAPILMLSMHPEELYALKVLKTGANGFLNKSNAPDELVNAINRILSGKKYITPILAENSEEPTNNIKKERHELLSDRELQIFQLLAKQRSVSEIATTTSLSLNLVNTYQKQILKKMGFTATVELTKYALDYGF